MTAKTPVERAAGLYETALQNRRGRECSEKQFFAARDQAETDLRNLLVIEGMPEPAASQMAAAGRLYHEARIRGLV